MKIFGIQARINENGRIVVPAVIRKGMGLKLGDSVVMSLEDGVLRIEPHRARVRKIQGETRTGAKSEAPSYSELADQQRDESSVEKESEKEAWIG